MLLRKSSSLLLATSMMLIVMLAAAVPALAQSVTQVGSGNQACVQTAVQAEVGKVQVSQYGDNVNIQNIAQQCNVNGDQAADLQGHHRPVEVPPLPI
jgi:competence protein ComGC